VERIEAPDPYTVHVHYAKPYAKALQTWTYWMLPRHLLETYMKEGRLREAPQNRDRPVGTGPYRLAKYVRSSKITLEANPDYRARTWDFAPGE